MKTMNSGRYKNGDTNNIDLGVKTTCAIQMWEMILLCRLNFSGYSQLSTTQTISVENRLLENNEMSLLTLNQYLYIFRFRLIHLKYQLEESCLIQ